MTEDIKNLQIVVAGGDQREVELYRIWRQEGLAVKLAGFENCPRVARADRARAAEMREAAVLIAPLTGIKSDATVYAAFAEEPLSLLQITGPGSPGLLLLAGSVAENLQPQISRQAKLVLTAGDPELALLNAVPTAEGAVQKAMELSPVTLHGSRALVVGLGRCGGVLARTLQGLGARVTVAVRRRESAAQASTMGWEAVFEESLPEAAGEADFIFNTAPAPVLGAGVLIRVKPETVILDLAAAPGGTDFMAAKDLGLNALLLPGLPGKAAPRTAGRILAMVYRRIILEHF